MEPQPTAAEFAGFIAERGPGLRHAFIARYGPDVGGEVMQDVIAYAWEHWRRVSGMGNPSGWLFRVGQSRSRRYLRRPVRLMRTPGESHELTRSGTPFRRIENIERISDWFVHFLVDGARTLPRT